MSLSLPISIVLGLATISCTHELFTSRDLQSYQQCRKYDIYSDNILQIGNLEPRIQPIEFGAPYQRHAFSGTQMGAPADDKANLDIDTGCVCASRDSKRRRTP